MSEQVLEWREPPTPETGGRGTSKWQPLLTALMERPGEWALLRSYANRRTASTTVTDLKRGRCAIDITPEDFEFTTRRSEDGGGEVYGRYLNGSSS